MSFDHPVRSSFRFRSPGSGVPLHRRNLLKAAGGLALGGAALGRVWQDSSAQRMDPFTFITTMESTTDVGQQVGQAAADVEPTTTEEGTWDAYIQLPIKEGQDFHYTCEFDSAWIILKAYGHDIPILDQLEIIGHDLSIEPYWDESTAPVTIIGGAVDEMYCGDYTSNILARSRATAMAKVFDSVKLPVTFVSKREEIEREVTAGHPVFFKSTVDFLDWREALWNTPKGDEYPCVLTNDHALVVMGFNQDNVIIRDPLGPTSTNEQRPWQYHVGWDRFIEVLASQDNDAFAVAPAAAS